MAQANGAQGFYYIIEARFSDGNDLDGSLRATARALWKLASEVTFGTGAYRYSTEDLCDEIQKFDYRNWRPSERNVTKSLSGLEAEGIIRLFRNRYVFVLDYWSYGHNPKNANHWINANKALAALPSDVREAFRRHYTNPNGNGDSIPDGIGDTMPDQQSQSHTQSQVIGSLEEEPLREKEGVATDAADGSAAPARPTPSRKKQPEDARWVKAAEWFAVYIEGKCTKFNISHSGVNNRSKEAARELRLLSSKPPDGDGYDLREVKDALQWAWESRAFEDGKPYGSVLLSIQGWRKKRDGVMKIVRCLNMYRDSRSSGGAPVERRPEAVKL